jgi:WNK lysine deficient protein kinase
MVKELEITDRDPVEIAAMIEQEIERLLPGRRQQHEYSVHVADGDDDDDENEERPPPFCYLSSSPTSSSSHGGSLDGGVGPYAASGGWSRGTNI